jgi:rod shape-determining protein MreC
MARFSDETYTYVIAAVSIAVVGFVLHITGILRPVESYLVRGVAPVQSFFYRQGVNISEGFGLITSIRAVAEENATLSDRVKDLEVANAELKEAQIENEKLKEQLGFINETGFQTIPATVIGSDPNNFLKSLLINRGADEGIEKGHAVLDEKGVLIGKILEVDKKTSVVLLITDSNSSFVGIAQDSRSTGSVVGELGLALKMTSIAQEDQVQEGERVVTAGLEDNVPKGLAIGTLRAIEGKDNELFKEAKIEPFGDFKNIELVFVLK